MDTLRRVAVVVICAALLTTLPTACASSRPTTSVSRSTGLGSQLKPGEDPALQRLTGKRRGGTLTVYTSSDFDSLDPGQSYYVLDYAID